MERKYAPPDHPVFQITPPEFNRRAIQFLEHNLNSPVVTMHTFWDIYTSLLNLFKSETKNNVTLGYELADLLAEEQQVNSETVDLMEGQAELRYNGMVIGPNEELPDAEIANPFFHHDSENYLEVDFTDKEDGEDLDSDQSDMTVEFTDSETEVAQSLMG